MNMYFSKLETIFRTFMAEKSFVNALIPSIGVRSITVFLSFLFLLTCLPAGKSPLLPGLQTVVAMAAETGKTNWKQQWDKIVAEAKKEGNLSIYTSGNGGDVRKIGAAFTEKYGIKVDVVSARGPELEQKMETQRRAGKYEIDVFLVGATNMINMKPNGYLDRFDNTFILPELSDSKAWIAGSFPYIDKERFGIHLVTSVSRHVIKNTQLVKDGEISSYKELLNPRWKGKIVMLDPTIAGSGNAFMGTLETLWGMEETKQFLRQLIKQELTITRDVRQVVEWVARGKYDIGAGTNGATIGEFVKAGAPISPIIASEGGTVTSMSYGLGIVTKRPHGNATAVFTNWILSREGQTVLSKSTGLPGVRSDSSREGVPPFFYPQPGEKYIINNEDNFKMEKEMLKVAADIFNPILK